jgi:hypothetical protein
VEPGEVVAERFVIERVAGTGGMGTVYRALDRATGAPVALKVLFAQTPQTVDRFLREADYLARLEHPGIVGFVARGSTPTSEPYLAMEWLAGESLADRLARGRLSTAEVVVLGRCVAEALAAAHAERIVHRDLKPQNLFLVGGRLDIVKILDFGVARLLAHGQTITHTGASLGTLGFMSPEQARGMKEIDARSDLFSLACVLYQCLSGQPPFTGNALEVILKIVTEPAPPLATLGCEVPPALEELLQRMLAKEPADRPVGAAAVAAALAALEPTSPPPTPLPQATVASQPTPEPPRRTRRLAIAWSTVAAALVAVTLAVLLPRRGLGPSSAVGPASASRCGDDLACAAVSFRDPAHIDEAEVRPRALDLARSVEPTSTLCEISVNGVTDGTVALGPEFASRSGTRSMSFDFVPANQRGKSLRVMVSQLSGQLRVVEGECEGAVAPPGCGMRAAYQAAVAAGLHRESHISVRYSLDDVDGPTWVVHEDYPAKWLRFDGRTCKQRR